MISAQPSSIDSPSSKDAILAAAEHRFAGEGFERTTLEAIGRDVGLRRPAVLYHFKGKRELYRAVLARLFVPVFEQVRAALLGPGPLPDRIHAMVRLLIEVSAANPNLPRLATRELTTRSDDVTASLQEIGGLFRSLLETTIEEGQRAGVIRPEADLLRLASALVGPIFYYFATIPAHLGESLESLMDPKRLAALEADVIRSVDDVLGIGAKEDRRA